MSTTLTKHALANHLVNELDRRFPKAPPTEIHYLLWENRIWQDDRSVMFASAEVFKSAREIAAKKILDRPVALS